MQNWMDAYKKNRARDIESKALRARRDTEQLNQLFQALPEKDGDSYIKQIRSINNYMKNLLHDIATLSYYQEFEKSNNEASLDDVYIDNVDFTTVMYGDGSIHITTPLPQKRKKNNRNLDSHIGKILENEIDSFMKKMHLAGPLYDKANVKMIFHFGPDVPTNHIPDPDNVAIKGILDAMLMKFIRSDSLADIDLQMTGAIDEEKSYLEMIVTEK